MTLRQTLFASLAAMALAAPAQRIAVLSDVHVTPGNANEQQLRRAVDEINAGNYDIVVMNGDLGNEGSDVELANVKSILSFCSPIVLLVVTEGRFILCKIYASLQA